MLKDLLRVSSRFRSVWLLAGVWAGMIHCGPEWIPVGINLPPISAYLLSYQYVFTAHTYKNAPSY